MGGFLHQGGGMTVAGFLILSMVLFRQAPGERRSILLVTKIFGLALILVFLGNNLGRVYPTEGSILRIVGIFLEGLMIISLLATGTFRVILPSLTLPSPKILQDVITFVGQAIWGIYCLQGLGVNLNGIIATSAVLTGVIGFSMQDTLGNILGGLAIQVDESIQVGDWIKIDDLNGRVVETSWRYTAVETKNWETIIIPNSILMKNKFLVLGRRQGQPLQWRRWIWFNVDYRFSPEKVIQAVEAGIRSAEIGNVSKDPLPQCLIMDFTESYGRYALRYWLTDLAKDDGTDSMVRTHLYSALKRAGLPLSKPAYAVFMTQETDERRAGKIAKEMVRRVNALQHVDLFKGLKEDERQNLAQRLVPAPFVTGDVMTRQGAEAHWLYIICEGQADVIVTNRDLQERKVASLGPGNFFGEMGLMAGEPRHATVIARSAVFAYRLDRDSFRDIIHSRPEIAHDISVVLAKRHLELEMVVVDLDEETRSKRLSEGQTNILEKIRSFFGLM